MFDLPRSVFCPSRYAQALGTVFKPFPSLLIWNWRGAYSSQSLRLCPRDRTYPAFCVPRPWCYAYRMCSLQSLPNLLSFPFPASLPLPASSPIRSDTPHRVKKPSQEILTKMHAPAKPEYPFIRHDILKTYDAFIIDIPTRYSDMPAKVWFCSSSSLHSFSRPLLSVSSHRSFLFLRPS